jgi:hypothetical protein
MADADFKPTLPNVAHATFHPPKPPKGPAYDPIKRIKAINQGKRQRGKLKIDAVAAQQELEALKMERDALRAQVDERAAQILTAEDSLPGLDAILLVLWGATKAARDLGNYKVAGDLASKMLEAEGHKRRNDADAARIALASRLEAMTDDQLIEIAKARGLDVLD